MEPIYYCETGLDKIAANSITELVELLTWEDDSTGISWAYYVLEGGEYRPFTDDEHRELEDAAQ